MTREEAIEQIKDEIKKRHPYLISATPYDEDFLIPIVEDEVEE